MARVGSSTREGGASSPLQGVVGALGGVPCGCDVGPQCGHVPKFASVAPRLAVEVNVGSFNDERFYPVYCGLYEIQYKTVALDEQLKIRVEDYLPGASVGRVGGIIFPNPNAPTGAVHALGEVERIVSANQEVVVVVDEAYVDFGAETAVSLIKKYPNLLVVHTLSKSRSLAGLRVGYAMGHPDLIQGLDRVKNCFNSYPLDRLAIAGATAAIEDQAHFEQTRDAVLRSRAALTAGLEKLGFDVLPSAANFIFAKHPAKDGAAFAAALRDKNIIVRHFKAPRINQYLRITIGTDQECEKLLDACRAILR